MSERMVKCAKLEKELPGLEKAPFAGEIGELIFERISAEAWRLWQDMQIKVINEYRLNMGERKDYDMLVEQMLAFLNLADAQTVEVGDEKRGRGEGS